MFCIYYRRCFDELYRARLLFNSFDFAVSEFKKKTEKNQKKGIFVGIL